MAAADPTAVGDDVGGRGNVAVEHQDALGEPGQQHAELGRHEPLLSPVRPEQYVV